MRKIFLFTTIAILAACTSGTSTADKTTTEMPKASDSMAEKQPALTYAYTADYSSDFEMGDAKNAQTLLKLYKDWDNNTLNNSKEAFAAMDTMYSSDGHMFAGPRDSFFIMANKVRSQMGTVVDSVHAWVPLKTRDKNEQWVAIWTREISTNEKGVKKSKELHEVWRFDNNGKINLCYQYEQMPPKMPPMPMNKK